VFRPPQSVQNEKSVNRATPRSLVKPEAGLLALCEISRRRPVSSGFSFPQEGRAFFGSKQEVERPCYVEAPSLV
jgi:hypothetical protein